MAVSANPIWGDGWEDVRSLWALDPDVAHCNHGSFGAVPTPVVQAQDELRARVVSNPCRWYHTDLPGLVVEARSEITRFVGADPGDVALVTNATAGVSSVLQSLALGPADEVVVTDHVYGAVSLAVDRFCARTGASRVVAEVPYESTDEEIAAIVGGRCSERTGLVVIDQITSPTARRFPVEAIAAVAHSHGAAVLVDGAHTPGQLPLDVPLLGADFWVGNLHKWACAPAGTGALWVTPDWQSRILPLVVSHDDRDGFPASFDRVGTNDLTPWLAAPHALRLLDSLGWDRVRAHNEALVAWAQATVAEILGVSSDRLQRDPGLSMAIVPLPPGVADDRKEARALQDHMDTIGIEMAVPSWSDHGAIRLSAQVYNQPADYERLALAVRDYIRA
jgi:isopenicillin-N epimerase